ncbi:hypothetical protein [Actinoplanes aureus]|uniref:Uncharacterized protein n=1 Tax=Actinoplanes aureus TaxID=2792083 RepID=A0A931CJJ6_9ACTN|nr:hypothetical protein [Actinoplanes aureus]MBG0568822.1 hypothetical protein [Actinoplanes aureus]
MVFGAKRMAEDAILVGAAILALGLFFGVTPVVLLIGRLRAQWRSRDRHPTARHLRPDEFAVRRGFRRHSMILIGWSLVQLLAAAAIVAAFWFAPAGDVTTAGQRVTALVIGAVVAVVPGVLGFAYLRCGVLLSGGFGWAIDSALLAGRVGMTVGCLVTVGVVITLHGRPVMLTAVIVGGLAAATTVLDWRLRLFRAQVEQLPPHPPDSKP